MKAVVLSLEDPWAESHGGTLRVRAITTALARIDVDVVAVYPSTAPSQPVIPGVALVPIPARTWGERSLSVHTRKIKRHFLPIPTQAGAKNPAISGALRDVIGADLLVISQLTAARYLDDLAGARLWFDNSDLWSEFAHRETKRRRGIARVTSDIQRRRIDRKERQISREARLVTAAGWKDAETLRQRIPNAVHWLPTPISISSTTPVAKRERSRPVAGFLGNFEFGPNIDALEVLKRVWGPRLREAGWDLIVAGLHSEQLELPSWIRLLGPVAEPRDFYTEVDMALAPIHLGGGMKVKVIEALMYGIPVTASAFAMDGFPPAMRDLVTIVNDADPQFDPYEDNGPMPDLTNVLQPFTTEGFTNEIASVLLS